MTNHACCKYLSHSFAEARDLSNSGNKQIFHSNLSCIFVKEIILLESNKRMKCSKRKFTFQGLDRQDCCQFGNLPAICSFCGFLYAKWKYTLNAEIVQYKDNTTILLSNYPTCNICICSSVKVVRIRFVFFFFTRLSGSPPSESKSNSGRFWCRCDIDVDFLKKQKVAV